jgi:aminoglycoside 6-adenylyltransferase
MTITEEARSQNAAAYTQLLDRFVAWAQSQPDIRAALLVGSRARAERPADEWSDLDIIVLSTRPERYLAETDWVANVGTPWLTFIEKTGTGDERERRVLFAGGLDVDFALIPSRKAQQLQLLLRLQRRFPQLLRLLPSGMARQFRQGLADFADLARRGVRVLLDKDGIAAYLALVTAETVSPRPPTPNEFLEVVNDFWYHTVWTAKKLRRGELWVAKSCGDGYLKHLLLRMIEWHARASHGWDYDTWHGGRFLEQWADPRAVQGLRQAFAHYDEDEVGRALLVTMDLFRWLATETARQLGYPYPAAAEERVTELVAGLCHSEHSEEPRPRMG